MVGPGKELATIEITTEKLGCPNQCEHL